MKKTIFTTIVFAILITMALPFAVASIEVESVRVNGDTLINGTTERLELNENLDIRIRLVALENVSDVRVTAELTGYRFADRDRYKTHDVIVINDLQQGDAVSRTLQLQVPRDIDQDRNTLEIRFSNKDGTFAVYYARLNIRSEGSLIDIRRVSFDPAEVVAGRALRTRVRLDNIGIRDHTDVFVQVAIPQLGPSMVVSADVDRIRSGELVTTEDLLLRIPACVTPGLYDVVVKVYYDNDHESTTQTEQIRILEGECDSVADSVKPTEPVVDRTVITPPTAQNIVAGGASTSFPVIIRNEGTTDKIYVVSVSGLNGWGSAEVSSSATLVRAKSSEIVYAHVSANIDAVGMKTFVVSVTDGASSKDIPVQAIVSEAVVAQSTFDWKQWVYTGIIALLVLIIILGLIVGFRKASKNDEEEYY